MLGQDTRDLEGPPSTSPGPIGSALSTKFGPRPVVMTGGILAALGLLLASFATSLTHLYLSIGLLSGEILGKGRGANARILGSWVFFFFLLLPKGCERSARKVWLAHAPCGEVLRMTKLIKKVGTLGKPKSDEVPSRQALD